jgi:hypothetical protein
MIGFYYKRKGFQTLFEKRKRKWKSSPFSASSLKAQLPLPSLAAWP